MINYTVLLCQPHADNVCSNGVRVDISACIVVTNTMAKIIWIEWGQIAMSYHRNLFSYVSSLLFHKTDIACCIRNVLNVHIQSVMPVVVVDVTRQYLFRCYYYYWFLLDLYCVVVACDDSLGSLWRYSRCRCCLLALNLMFHLDLEQRQRHRLLQLLVLSIRRQRRK